MIFNSVDANSKKHNFLYWETIWLLKRLLDLIITRRKNELQKEKTYSSHYDIVFIDNPVPSSEGICFHMQWWYIIDLQSILNKLFYSLSTVKYPLAKSNATCAIWKYAEHCCDYIDIFSTLLQMVHCSIFVKYIWNLRYGSICGLSWLPHKQCGNPYGYG